MTLIPVDLNNVKLNLQNDCQHVRTFLEWLDERYQAYNQNLTTEVMNGLGIASGDQGFINAFVGDINRMRQISSGVQDVDGTDFRYDIAGVLGVM